MESGRGSDGLRTKIFLARGGPAGPRQPGKASVAKPGAENQQEMTVPAWSGPTSYGVVQARAGDVPLNH